MPINFGGIFQGPGPSLPYTAVNFRLARTLTFRVNWADIIGRPSLFPYIFNVADTADIDQTFDSVTSTLSSVLTTTGVTAGTFGLANGLSYPRITIDSKGRITAASEVAVDFPIDSVANTTYINLGISLGVLTATLNTTATDGRYWKFGGNTTTAEQGLGSNDPFDVPLLRGGSEIARIGTSGIGIGGPAVSRLTIPVAPAASANTGLVSIGSGGFAGGGTNFIGSASGTGIAANFATGFAGSVIDLQIAGASIFNATSEAFNVNLHTFKWMWSTYSGATGENLFWGTQAGQSFAGTSFNSIYIGPNVAKVLSGAPAATHANVWIGANVGQNNPTSLYSTLVGAAVQSSSRSNGALDGVTSIGYHSALANRGVSIVSIGAFSLAGDNDGNCHISIGRAALTSNTTGDRNWAVGFEAGTLITTGSFNLLAGFRAGDNLTTGSRNIIIGYNLDVLTATTSNFMSIGNAIYATGIDGESTTISAAKIGILINAPTTELEVASTSTTSPRGITSSQWSNSIDGARIYLKKSRGTSAGATGTIQSGDEIGRIVGTAWDSATYLESTAVVMGTEGTIASGRVPTYLEFYTSTDTGPSVQTLAMKITSAQRVGIGITSSAQITAKLTLRGIGTTTGVTLLIQNSTPSTVMSWADDGTVLYGAGARFNLENSGVTSLAGGEWNIQATVAPGIATSSQQFANVRFSTNVAGWGHTGAAEWRNYMIIGGPVFNPTSGSGSARNIWIKGEINQTGGASGAYISLDVDTTETALVGAHYAALFRRGRVGFNLNTAAPTAFAHFGAGTTALAAIKLTTGAALTTIAAGAGDGGIEYVSPNLSFIDSSTRYMLPKGLTGTATLNFGNTAAQTSADLTITVTGAAVNDEVVLGVPNGSADANSCYTAWVSAANTVTVRFNNYSSGAIDPASNDFKVFVIKR